MMDELKRLLSSAEIEYTERVFASTDGIGTLSTPFVSCNDIVVLYRTFVKYTTLTV